MDGLSFLDNRSFFVNKTSSATKGMTTGLLLSLKIHHIIDLSAASLRVFLGSLRAASDARHCDESAQGRLSRRLKLSNDCAR
jgi:hypothetical protein